MSVRDERQTDRLDIGTKLRVGIGAVLLADFDVGLLAEGDFLIL